MSLFGILIVFALGTAVTIFAIRYKGDHLLKRMSKKLSWPAWVFLITGIVIFSALGCLKQRYDVLGKGINFPQAIVGAVGLFVILGFCTAVFVWRLLGRSATKPPPSLGKAILYGVFECIAGGLIAIALLISLILFGFIVGVWPL